MGSSPREDRETGLESRRLHLSPGLPREIQHREALVPVTSRFRGNAVPRDSSLVTLECNPRVVIEILTRSVLLENQRRDI